MMWRWYRHWMQGRKAGHLREMDVLVAETCALLETCRGALLELEEECLLARQDIDRLVAHVAFARGQASPEVLPPATPGQVVPAMPAPVQLDETRRQRAARIIE